MLLLAQFLIPSHPLSTLPLCAVHTGKGTIALKPSLGLISEFLCSVLCCGHCLCPDTPSPSHFFNTLCASFFCYCYFSIQNEHLSISQDSVSACSSLEMSSLQGFSYDHLSARSHCSTSNCLLDVSTCLSYYYLKLKICQI